MKGRRAGGWGWGCEGSRACFFHLGRGSGCDQIVGAFRDDMTHAAARVRHVAMTPWDHMEMRVRHGLAGRGSGVDTEIERVNGAH